MDIGRKLLIPSLLALSIAFTLVNKTVLGTTINDIAPLKYLLKLADIVIGLVDPGSHF